MSDHPPDHFPIRKRPRIGHIALIAVVIAALCFAGYEWNWIRQRRQIVDRQVTRVELLGNQLTDVVRYAEAPARMPLSMRPLLWFGENPRQMTILILYDDNGSGKLSEQHRNELSEARSLFPESGIAWKLTNP
jgi:hypothetical protein